MKKEYSIRIPRIMVDVAILDWRAKEGLSEKILFDGDLNDAKGKAT